jgi:hypothetical protein
MSQTHNTLAAELLEVSTCPTSASVGAARVHEEVLGTKTDVHDPASNQRPKELNDIKQQSEQKDLKQVPGLTGS